jgi:hypothetical protein
MSNHHRKPDSLWLGLVVEESNEAAIDSLADFEITLSAS